MFLTDAHREVLRSIFRTPYASPLSELREDTDGTTGLPTIRQTLCLQIPMSAFPASPTTFRDLITSNLGENNSNRCFRDLLLMFSAIVSDEELGTRSGTEVDPNAAQVGDGAAPAAGGAGPNNAGRGGGGGGRRGAGANAAAGGAPGATTQGGVVQDRRGEVTDGNGLMFQFGTARFPKVITCVEERLSESLETQQLGLWFFVLDPLFDFSRAFERLIQRNAELYRGRRTPDNIYLQHADIQSTTDFINRIALPYLRNGADNRAVPECVRIGLRQRIEQLSNPEYIRQIGVPLSHHDHPANPERIFNKTNMFALYAEDIGLTQRDPANYYTIGNASLNAAVRILSGNGRQDNSNNNEARVAADNGAMDDEDMDDPDLVVPNDVVEYDNGDAMDIDEDERTMEALLQKVDKKLVENAVADGADLDAGGNEDDADLQRTNAEIERQAVLNQHLIRLRLTSDDAFQCFPIPEHVSRISSAKFGRSLLNTPLPHRIRTMTTNSLRAGEVVVDANDIRKEADIEDSATKTHHDEMDVYFSDPKVDPKELYKRRKAALTQEMDKLNKDEIPQITSAEINNIKSFRDALRGLRMQVSMIDKQRERDKARAEIEEMMRNTAAISFQSASSSDDLSTHAYGSFLPETLNQRLSQAEFATFAQNHVLMQLRFKNLKEKIRIARSHRDPKARREALLRYDERAVDEFWDVMQNSNKLPPALRSAMDWFKKLPPMKQWGEHLDLAKNLSSFANMILTMLSRYNGIFRGSTNQQAFMVTTFCHFGTFEYDWGIKQNLLLMGKGSAGKSYVFEIVELMTCPGTFSSWSHTTDKAFSTGTSFSDQTFCMHEAPLSYIAVDKYGHATLADPLLKDRLARQRSGTRYFTQDEQGNRITREDLVMVMGNMIIATNDAVPPSDSPLMQRFLTMPISETKREDFNIGDHATPLKDLLSGDVHARHVHFAQLESFYLMILCKMIMAGILPEISTDASELLIPEIHGEFTRLTHISTSHPRKRKMLSDFTRIIGYTYVVHVALFSLFAVKHNQTSANGGGGGGKVEFRAFHPMMLYRESVPRLWVTDEIVIYAITLLSFMFDSNNRYRILETIANHLNTPVISGKPFALSTVNFRIMHNQGYINAGGPGSWQGYKSRMRSMTYSKGDATATATVQSTEFKGNGTNDDEAENDTTSSPFLIDPDYVVLTEDNWQALWARICSVPRQEAPAPNEVIRILKELVGINYKAHPSILKKVEQPKKVLQLQQQQQQRARQEPQGRRPMSLFAEAIGDNSNTMFERDSRSESDHSGGGLATSSSRVASLFTDVMQQTALNRNPVGAMSNRDASSEMMQEESNSQSRHVDPEAAIAAGDDNGNLMSLDFYNHHLKRRTRFQWKLLSDMPARDRPIVMLYQDPTDVRGRRVTVAVLLEYVLKEAHKDAMVEAITRVMSNNTIPPEGRTFLTGMPYVHFEEPENAEVEVVDAPGEIMPQYCRTLHIPRSEKDMLVKFARVGTHDSRAFNDSSLRFSTKGDIQTIISQEFNSNVGMKMESDRSINAYFAARHFIRCNLPLEGDTVTRAYTAYLPEVESAAIHKLLSAIAKKNSGLLEFIQVYPDDCVQAQLAERNGLNSERNSEFINNFFMSSTDALKRVARLNNHEDIYGKNGKGNSELDVADISHGRVDSTAKKVVSETVSSISGIVLSGVDESQINVNANRKNKMKQLQTLGKTEIDRKKQERARPAQLTDSTAAPLLLTGATTDSSKSSQDMDLLYEKIPGLDEDKERGDKQVFKTPQDMAMSLIFGGGGGGKKTQKTPLAAPEGGMKRTHEMMSGAEKSTDDGSGKRRRVNNDNQVAGY